jgi:hypothetical protein
VLEIYYDAEDSPLPQYVEPRKKKTMLSCLPRDVVESSIWPLIVQGPLLPSIQNMVRVSRVCRAWRDWVEDNDDWVEARQSYLESFLRKRKPWWWGDAASIANMKHVKTR